MTAAGGDDAGNKQLAELRQPATDVESGAADLAAVVGAENGGRSAAGLLTVQRRDERLAKVLAEKGVEDGIGGAVGVRQHGGILEQYY